MTVEKKKIILIFEMLEMNEKVRNLLNNYYRR